MTSPASVRSCRRSSGGFTLIELIIVVLVIALLGAILLPMVLRAQRSARKTRVAADFQTIGIALDAYKTDFGDYPRPQPGEVGSAVLGRALVSPGDTDGLPGPGFRVRVGGKPYPAYLQPDKFKMQGDALLDPFGEHPTFGYSPILYYPARPAMPKLSSANGFISNNANSLYNVAHNPVSPPAVNPPWLKAGDFARLLGDTNMDGDIDTGEAAAHTGPYILWSAGQDGMFGLVVLKPGPPVEYRQLDDVANFTFKNVPE